MPKFYQTKCTKCNHEHTALLAERSVELSYGKAYYIFPQESAFYRFTMVQDEHTLLLPYCPECMACMCGTFCHTIDEVLAMQGVVNKDAELPWTVLPPTVDDPSLYSRCPEYTRGERMDLAQVIDLGFGF